MVQKILALGLSITLLSSLTGEQPDNSSTVYICVSNGAKRYHLDKNCHGLKRCTHEVRKVSLESARKDFARTLCGYED